MFTRPYLMVLLAVFFISGCGSAEYPGKGAPKASVENDLSSTASAKKDMSQEIALPEPVLSGIERLLRFARKDKSEAAHNDSAVSATLEDDGAYEPNEDHLYIHAEEPPVDNRLAFLGPMDDYEEDAIEAEGAETIPDPSANETDCDYLSPGDPGYCQPAEVVN